MSNLVNDSESLRPRARIMRTIGDELISSNLVALTELVKNSYDADATKIVIRINKDNEGIIEVLDNGVGMTLDIIKRAWMEPATPFKKEHTHSKLHNRRVLGEKGIGRFAASKLADSLEISTRYTNSPREAYAFFDWTQFDDDNKYLDEIRIPRGERDPIDLSDRGAIRCLWEVVKEQVPNDEDLSGTILRMNGIRGQWGKNEIESLKIGLSRLLSPFSKSSTNKEKTPVDKKLEIHLITIEDGKETIEPIEPPEIFNTKNAPYSLIGKVNSFGRYILKVRIRKEDKTHVLSGKFRLENNIKPQCGPFSINIRSWDRDTASLNELVVEFNSSLRDIRDGLDEYAGMSIYRDGFRVMPYGEPKNDWLRLDLRSRQNPTMRLANNQIIGYVSISSDENPGLRDQSNREGLIEGIALLDFEILIKKVLNEIEVLRYSFRRDKEIKLKKNEKKGLFSDFDLERIQQLVKKNHPEDEQLVQLIDKTQGELKTKIDEAQETISRYRRLATLGQLIDAVLHEGRAPLAAINNEVFFGLDEIESNNADNLKTSFNIISEQVEVLSSLFKRIEPFGGRKRGKPKEIKLEDAIKDSFKIFEPELNRMHVIVNLPSSQTSVTVDKTEIQEVIINLLQNSIYWLRYSNKSNRYITVDVNRNSDNEVEIIFADSGPGVKDDIKDKIFDTYFSGKEEDGIGLGLSIAGEIISDYYAGEIELLNEGPLSGAVFRIILRRRV
jgi:signal transduction histidine kinase